MTRARDTLVLSRLHRRHAFLDALTAQPGCVVRPLTAIAPAAEELGRKYRALSLAQVDLGFAGRYDGRHALHRAIAALAPGDPLALRRIGEKWELVDSNGACVGRLAGSYSPPENMVCTAASVRAIVTRLRDDSDPDYRNSLRCDRWEVVVPELVFGPRPRSESRTQGDSAAPA
jgi:ATP-dependent DNA helicase RecQ